MAVEAETLGQIVLLILILGWRTLELGQRVWMRMDSIQFHWLGE
jgi:hypothetical protein